MSGFKLLAIVPLHNCNKGLIKSLEAGQVYQFYKNYEILLSSDKTKILSAKKTPDIVPEDFFDLENGIRLNISAVVGENGSGKSSLFEVMYYLIYQRNFNKEFQT
jgi:AAA15 family ATPase/GTPase